MLRPCNVTQRHEMLIAGMGCMQTEDCCAAKAWQPAFCSDCFYNRGACCTLNVSNCLLGISEANMKYISEQPLASGSCWHLLPLTALRSQGAGAM